MRGLALGLALEDESSLMWSFAEDRGNSHHYKNVLHLTSVNCLDSLSETIYCVYLCNRMMKAAAES